VTILIVNYSALGEVVGICTAWRDHGGPYVMTKGELIGGH